DISWTDGNQTFTASGIQSSPYLIPVSPGSNRNYSPVSVFSGCSGTVSGMQTVTVLPAPTATMSGSSTICPGASVALSIQLTGASPWDVQWTDGNSVTSVSGITSSPYVFTMSPVQHTQYSPVSVSAGSCTGSVSGNTNINTGA